MSSNWPHNLWPETVDNFWPIWWIANRETTRQVLPWHRKIIDHYSKIAKKLIFVYTQTWVNDLLWAATTCLHRPLLCGPMFNFYNLQLPLNNDHLSTTATNVGSRGLLLNTGLTVLSIVLKITYYWNSSSLTSCGLSTPCSSTLPSSWSSTRRSWSRPRMSWENWRTKARTKKSSGSM